MTLDEMIARFQGQLDTYLNVRGGLLKITLTHECFDRAMIDLYQKATPGRFSYTPSSMSDLKILGVRVEARAKDPRDD